MKIYVEDNHLEQLNTDRLLLIKSFSSSNREMWEIQDKGEDIPDWLRHGYPKYIGDVTIDFTPNYVYLNRIDVSPGKGFGTEALLSILTDLKSRGYKHFRTYIESNNYASQNMIRKLRFIEVEKKNQGSYWELN